MAPHRSFPLPWNATNGKRGRQTCEPNQATGTSLLHPYPEICDRSNMARPISRSTTFTPPYHNRLFFLNHEQHASPINTATLPPTANLADARHWHPYQIRMARKLANFDPTKLHWSVAAPYALSRSAFVRNTAARRVREAFRQELRRAGWDSDGRRLPQGGQDGQIQKFDLSGAVRLGLVKEPHAVTATTEEVRQSASWAVKTLFATHNRDMPQQNRSSTKNAGRKTTGDRTNRDASWKGRGERTNDTRSAGPTIRRVTHK